jgi:predicted nucleic acid-binding protein
MKRRRGYTRVLGVESAEAAARIRAQFRSLRLSDALVLGHAEAIGADAVLTTDRRSRRVSPRVRVV